MTELLLEQIEKMPKLPEAAAKAVRSFLKAPLALESCADILLEDDWLAGRFIELANDPLFGKTGRVGAVENAVSCFPPLWINEKAVGLAVCRCLLEGEVGHHINGEAFCVHALATAEVIREIGTLMGIQAQQQGEIYLLGLLHDLGKIYLDTMVGADYGEVLRMAKKGASLPAAENKVFSMTSQKVWVHTLKSWGLPKELVKAYKGVINGRISSNMKALIGTASRIAEMLGAHLIEGIADRSPFEKSEIMPLLTGENLLGISNNVQRQLGAYCEVLGLPHIDFHNQVYSLYDTAHRLSLSNAKRAKVQKQLELKVGELETLALVFTKIMKSLEGDSLSFSVMESFMAGFNSDCAFMLNSGPRGSFSGYIARFEDEDQSSVEVVDLTASQLSPSMKECISNNEIRKIEDFTAEEGKLGFLGDVSEAWIAPACVGSRCRALIGMGFRDGNKNRFTDNLDEILNIIAAEIGLSVENVRLYKMICKEAGTDYLTELDNRRNILSVLNTEFARFKRRGVPLSVALFDLDYFKTVNDNLGHLAGDMVLMKVAEILRIGVRESDYVGRYGGDEFIAVFPHTPIETAVEIVERIRQDVAEITQEYQMPHMEENLSISIGIASACESMKRFDDLVNAADQTLYRAKDSGRNCCLYE